MRVSLSSLNESFKTVFEQTVSYKNENVDATRQFKDTRSMPIKMNVSKHLYFENWPLFEPDPTHSRKYSLNSDINKIPVKKLILKT